MPPHTAQQTVFQYCLVLCSLLLLSACGNQQPKLGSQYLNLPTPVTNNHLPAVLEIFSLQDKASIEFSDELPKLEQLIQQSIVQLPTTNNDNAKVAALIYYALIGQIHHRPSSTTLEGLFHAFQHSHSNSEQQALIDQLFQQKHLVSPYQFDEIQQRVLLHELNSAIAINHQQQITALPSFIINGKYQVLLSGHKDIQSLANTINYLLSHT